MSKERSIPARIGPPSFLSCLAALPPMRETECMRNRWPILALLCVLASLLAGGIASAHSSTGAENRVWDSSVQGQTRAGGAAALTLDLHPGCELAEYDSASDSPLAAKGGGLGANPFKGKTPAQIDKMLRDKGYVPKGPDPLNGKGTYLNPKTGRSFHIDANHPPPKSPHVGVQRPRGQRGLPQGEYPLE